MLTIHVLQSKFMTRMAAAAEWPTETANNSMMIIADDEQQLSLHWVSMERELVDYVEMASLCLLISFGTLLNSLAFARLIRYSRPCPGNAAKSLLTGPLYMNSFTLLKFNLALTDFAILLVHALGKLVWLLSYRWLFGDIGCRLYQFLSAFSYYSNSNIVIAIGLDRLKVVYSSRVQGTVSSIRRVRLLLAIAWTLAFVCALPQLFFWTNYELKPGWSQCTTIWQIAEHLRPNASSSSSALPRQHWSSSRLTQLYYELLHQAAVFVIPFISLFTSYLLIVLRVLRYTLQPNSSAANNAYNSSYLSLLIGHDNWSAAAAAEESGRRRSSFFMSWRFKGISSRCFLFHKLHLLSQKDGGARRTSSNGGQQGRRSSDRLAIPIPASEVQLHLCTAPPPPSPNDAVSGVPCRVNPFSESNQTLADNFQSRKGSEAFLVHRMGSCRPFGMGAGRPRKLSAEVSSSNGLALSSVARTKRSSLNVYPSSMDTAERHPQTHHLLLSSDPTGPSAHSSQQHQMPHAQTQIDRRHRHSVGKPSLRGGSISGPGANSPVWRRQLRSKVFLRALLIVAAHCAFWLPYNLLNLLRFADESLYSWLVERGALLVEDLIVMNAMINPILYGHGRQKYLREGNCPVPRATTFAYSSYNFHLLPVEAGEQDIHPRMELSEDMRIIRVFSLFACFVFLVQMLVIADWVDEVIEVVNQKMAPWHALLEKYERALQTMESEERELTRIKQIIEKKIEMHQKKLKKLLIKVLGNATFDCKLR